MASSAPLAVVCARYSSRKSRILLWETEHDVFQLGQWLKGGIDPCELSHDGQYFAYYVGAASRGVRHYLAVSRPPFLTALFFRPLGSPDGIIGFDGHWLNWYGWGRDGSEIPGHPEYGYGRLTPGCPFQVRERDRSFKVRDDLATGIETRNADQPAVHRAVERHGERARMLLTDPRKGIGILPAADRYLAAAGQSGYYWRSHVQATWDHQDRLIIAIESKVLAFRPDKSEPEILLDLSQTVFSTMPTPDWAKEW